MIIWKKKVIHPSWPISCACYLMGRRIGRKFARCEYENGRNMHPLSSCFLGAAECITTAWCKCHSRFRSLFGINPQLMKERCNAIPTWAEPNAWRSSSQITIFKLQFISIAILANLHVVGRPNRNKKVRKLRWCTTPGLFVQSVKLIFWCTEVVGWLVIGLWRRASHRG